MKTQSNDTSIVVQQKTLSIKRTINLPLTAVWKAWTEPESAKEWWGPKNFTCPYCTIDLRVGGKNLSCMKSKEGQEFWSTGTFVEIIPMKKLVYIDSFSDSDGHPVPPSHYNMPGVWGNELKVTVTFEEVDGKTVMNLEHEGIPEEMFDDCVLGWQQSFDKMDDNLK